MADIHEKTIKRERDEEVVIHVPDGDIRGIEAGSSDSQQPGPRGIQAGASRIQAGSQRPGLRGVQAGASGVGASGVGAFGIQAGSQLPGLRGVQPGTVPVRRRYTRKAAIPATIWRDLSPDGDLPAGASGDQAGSQRRGRQSDNFIPSPLPPARPSPKPEPYYRDDD